MTGILRDLPVERKRKAKMGKKQHSKDRMYITKTEWATEWGGAKSKELHTPFKRLPFYCCAYFSICLTHIFSIFFLLSFHFFHNSWYSTENFPIFIRFCFIFDIAVWHLHPLKFQFALRMAVFLIQCLFLSLFSCFTLIFVSIELKILSFFWVSIL